MIPAARDSGLDSAGAASGIPQAFGPIVAGLGVALGYVALIQKRH